MSTLFLDVDGVLNDHSRNAAGICGLKPSCVTALNRVLEATDCQVVISSAWRYMTHRAMNLQGFEYLLMTHSVLAANRVLGVTPSDEVEPRGRGEQIAAWIHAWESCGNEVGPYAVLDDGGIDSCTGEWTDMGITEAGHPIVWTDGKVGLTEEGADRLIELLNGVPFHPEVEELDRRP